MSGEILGSAYGTFDSHQMYRIPIEKSGIIDLCWVYMRRLDHIEPGSLLRQPKCPMSSVEQWVSVCICPLQKLDLFSNKLSEPCWQRLTLSRLRAWHTAKPIPCRIKISITLVGTTPRVSTVISP